MPEIRQGHYACLRPKDVLKSLMSSLTAKSSDNNSIISRLQVIINNYERNQDTVYRIGTNGADIDDEVIVDYDDDNEIHIHKAALFIHESYPVVMGYMEERTEESPGWKIEEPSVEQTTKGNKMSNIKNTAAALVGQNKDNAISVARVTAGKAINKKLVSLVKPKLPMMARGFADNPVFALAMANAIAFGIKNYTENSKANLAADMMLEAAAFQTAEAFEIDDMIEDLLDGISLPGGESLDFNIATAKTAELRTFAAENNISLEGVAGIANIRNTITEALEG